MIGTRLHAETGAPLCTPQSGELRVHTTYCVSLSDGGRISCYVSGVAAARSNVPNGVKMVSCKACGKREEELDDGLLMQRCTGCFAVSYCDADCQTTHLSDHRAFCKERAAENEWEHSSKQQPNTFTFNIAVLAHAIDAGDALAMLNLGICYQFGKGGVDMDAADAVHWYKRATEAHNPPVAAFTNLAECYFGGVGVRKNLPEAARLYRIAAGMGDTESQVQYGDLLQRGQGVPYDPVEAFTWYKRAAGMGDSNAQGKAGDALMEGYGVPQDTNAAVAYYRRAADEGGCVSAMYKLGLYFASSDVAWGKSHAMAWYTRACGDSGYAPAGAARAALFRTLTADERAEADSLLNKMMHRARPSAPARRALAPTGGAGGAPTAPPPTRAEVASMGTAALKRFLQTTGVDTSGITEKGRLVELALVGAAR